MKKFTLIPYHKILSVNLRYLMKLARPQDSMFRHQPGHISIMNTEHEIHLTAILDLHVPLTLSVPSINVRSDRLNI